MRHKCIKNDLVQDGSIFEIKNLITKSEAKKLIDMPVLVLPFSLGIVLFPYFSELAISNQTEKLTTMLMHAIKIIALIFIPLAVASALLRETVIQIVFERGAFDVKSTQITSSALFYYSLGLFTFAVEAVAGAAHDGAIHVLAVLEIAAR